jgi:hypothetical protein
MTAEKLPHRIGTKRAPKVDHLKVGKLLRLLASDKAGEVIAAASALQRTLAAAGLDWHDLAGAAERGLQPAAPPKRIACWGPPLPSPDDWQGLC